MRAIALALIVALAPSVAFAHGGGTDPSGCHTDSSTGVRHCHGSSSGGGSGDSDVALIVLGTLVLVAGVGVLIYVNHKNKTTVTIAPMVSDDTAGAAVVVRF